MSTKGDGELRVSRVSGGLLSFGCSWVHKMDPNFAAFKWSEGGMKGGEGYQCNARCLEVADQLCCVESHGSRDSSQ